MRHPVVTCLMLLRQLDDFAVSRACCNAGNSMAARIAMIAITTRSSISVKLILFMVSLFLSFVLVGSG